MFKLNRSGLHHINHYNESTTLIPAALKVDGEPVAGITGYNTEIRPHNVTKLTVELYLHGPIEIADFTGLEAHA